ncbi:MAG: hypothetical protein DRJ47_10595 [Thermoprotei archaeon]|nr:MAG: hypothetical protein DRJ47_10595 [Thermoprotei archaeon]
MPVTRILITNDGKIVVEGIGYVGDQCLIDLQKLKNALQSLGIDVDIEMQQKKPEAYMSTEVAVHENQ